jgi:hypothetical protein
MLNYLGKRKGAKIALVLLSIFLFLLLFSQAASAARMGDVNGDGRIDVRDVVLVNKHVLEIPPLLTTDQQRLADVNGDGRIDVRDINLIMQYSLGIISEFPTEDPGTSAVRRVTALTSKIIGVEFYQTPSAAEKSDITITLRNASNAIVPITVSWDDNVAKLSRLGDASFVVGSYTVEVTGITPAYNGVVLVTAPAATRLEIEAPGLPVNTERAPLRVRLIDQFGDDLPVLQGAFRTTAYNITRSIDNIPIGFDPRAHFFINTMPTVLEQRLIFRVGDEVRVTFVHIATGIEKTVVLPVTEQTQLGSIEFGEVQLPTGRTAVTRDLFNIRIPITAKDQNGNPLFLVNGANVNLFSSEQTIISNNDLSFVTIAGQQYVNISRFLNKGNVIISILGTPGGVVGNKYITVGEARPFEFRVTTEPRTVLLPTIPGRPASMTSTLVRLNVVDQFGNPVLPTLADADYEIRIIKSSGGDNILAEPLNNASINLSTAATLGIQISSATVLAPNLPASETITFRLQKRDGTFVDSVNRTITVVQEFDRLDVSPDKSVYEAGENIIVTIEAKLGNQIHTDYNVTGLAEIKLLQPALPAPIEVEKVNRTITFREGIAQTSIPANKAGENMILRVTFREDPVTGAFHDSDIPVTVLPGPPSKFIIEARVGERTMEIKLTDSRDNVIETVTEERLLKFTYPDSFVARPPLDVEDQIRVTFNRGRATITFNNNFVRGAYTVKDEIWDIEGRRTLTD